MKNVSFLLTRLLQPVTNVSSPDIVCNSAANTYVTPYPPTKVIEVAAGANVTTEWHHTLAGLDTSDSADPIDKSHLVKSLFWISANRTQPAYRSPGPNNGLHGKG